METIKLKGSIYPIDEKNTKGIMTTQIKVMDLLRVYRIDPSVNRDINTSRLPKIVNYLDGFDSYPGVFFPSIMCIYPGDPTKNYDAINNELHIPKNESLIVIDGQHRIRGLESYNNNVKINKERKQQILDSDLTLQLYFGLTKEDMQNLFVDINSNAVKVSMSLITSYDNREILNLLTREIYELSNPLQSIGIEFNKSMISRPKNQNFSTSVRLKKFISVLLFNKKLIGLREEIIIKSNYDQILSFLERFFYKLVSLFPDKPGDVYLTILGHEAVQNALAFYLHNLIIIYDANKLNWALDWEEKIEELNNIDWKISNSSWKEYLIKARANTNSEFYTIDIKDEKRVLRKIQEMTN